MDHLNKPVIFQGRCYVLTTRGLRRASATREEMNEMPRVNSLDCYISINHPLYRTPRKVSRNRKSTFKGKLKSGVAYTRKEQRQRMFVNELRREQYLNNH